MLAALLAAAVVSAACDLEKPSGEPGCKREAVDALPMNRLQVVGTHNSYKAAIAPNEMATLKAVNPAAAITLDYAHSPLLEQLEAGARQLEIDVVNDPAGGLYANPLGYRMAGAAAVPYDFAPLKGPGLKVIHVPDVDYRSTCPTFVACLRGSATGRRPGLTTCRSSS
ncbi:MAG: Ca2+-dependent phosphoinositide-specific phospholipase C [Pseudomonadota bacterium]